MKTSAGRFSSCVFGIHHSATCRSLALAAILLGILSNSAFATIIVAHQYLFEDPSKVAGNPLGNNDDDVNNRVTDTVGTIHMQDEGSAGVYSATVPTGGNTVSTLSADINGAGGHVVATPNGNFWGTATDNFGIEAWVRPESTSGTRPIVMNGYSNMLGIYQIDGEYQLVLHTGGANTYYDFNTSITGVGEWDHVALVRDSGTATLYVNGVAAGSTTNAITGAPNAHSWIGGRDGGAGGSFDGIFDGQIDTVRYFTFTAGQFSVSDLDFNPIPEPTGFVLASMAAMSLSRFRRRRR